MRERPILFSAPMVRALLSGRKTVTRRTVTPQPPTIEAVKAMAGIDFSVFCPRASTDGRFSVGGPVWAVRNLMKQEPEWYCPYGRPGDRLWVRETWALVRPAITDGPWVEEWADWQGAPPKEPPGGDWVVLCREGYDSEDTAEERGFRWRPSIHMPRWASRLALEVTSVRVERLHAITEDDAVAEGVLPVDDPFGEDTEYWECHECECAGVLSARESFETLWNSINGASSWDVNPWVWRVEFKRVTP